ncbi:VOC family protein [Sporocytophaga myxococcoides]|uniref:VOC family protein n=1 Tax=Sporocytophaga myxococcoides TaxID=153721 RepID=UPI0004247A51|nr:VOC family protein [Sporocytophaga myxococcoides]
MIPANVPIPEKGFYVTHFLTVRDQAISANFYSEVLGGTVIVKENPCVIRLSNSWLILNSGGGPTPDKPDTILEAPQNSNKVDSFLNLRVADIQACYREWKEKGATFLTEPINNHGWEMRCYMKDPDGYIIEVGQSLQKSFDSMYHISNQPSK